MLQGCENLSTFLVHFQGILYLITVCYIENFRAIIISFCHQQFPFGVVRIKTSKPQTDGCRNSAGVPTNTITSSRFSKRQNRFAFTHRVNNTLVIVFKFVARIRVPLVVIYGRRDFEIGLMPPNAVKAS